MGEQSVAYSMRAAPLYMHGSIRGDGISDQLSQTHVEENIDQTELYS